MGSYVVLARKWRPAQFRDIVGQGPVVRTLMNAIRSDRIHHAYLLTGSRGIGKTSIARILAKAIRCPNATWDESQSLRSCDECSSCREIATGTSVDVIEIDGASNNGVDAVREIRENVKFLPSSGSKKIYIIDEVHMLTTAAFNALLKTLEEPPTHVLFILATTEPHKIPGTILSRCQRFDLKRVTVAQIQARLTEVALSEKINIESGALALLARAAEGSMRDAMSLFDQVISYAGNDITAEAVRESIGLIQGQTLIEILRGIYSRKPEISLSKINEAYRSGFDLKVIAKHLIELIHASIIVKIEADTESLELSEGEILELKELSHFRTLEEIELFFQVFHQGLDWISRSPQPRIVLEVLVIKCATSDSLHRMSSAPNGTPGKPETPSSPATTRSVPTPVLKTMPMMSQAPHTVSPAAAPQALATPTAPGPRPTSLLFGQNTAKNLNALQNPTPTAAAFSGVKSWENFISFVRPKRTLLASVLEHASCEKFPVQDGEDFVICFSEKDALYYKEQISNRLYQEQLNQLTKEFFGQSRKLIIETREVVESVAQKREDAKQKKEADARSKVLSHPIITEAKNLFGGELGPIEFTDDNTDGNSQS